MFKRALKHPGALLGVAMLLMMAALFATPAHAQATGGLTLNASPSAQQASVRARSPAARWPPARPHSVVERKVW